VRNRWSLWTWERRVHVTVTGQLPGVVRVPTSQVHCTVPEADAVVGPRPAAVLGPDLYSTSMEQAAPGAVPTVAVPGLPCPVAGSRTMVTVSGGAGRAVGGRLEGFGGRVVAGLVEGGLLGGRPGD